MGLFRGLRILIEQCQVQQDEHGERNELKHENQTIPGYWRSTCEFEEKWQIRLSEDLKKAFKE